MGKELRLSGQNFNLETALQFVQRRFHVEQHGASLMGLFTLTPEAASASLGSSKAEPPVFVSVEANGFISATIFLPPRKRLSSSSNYVTSC